MTLSSRIRSVVAGALVANGAPHLASAAAGRRHLTPLAGRDSAPLVNLAWGAANVVGGCVLLWSATRGDEDRWDGRLHDFEAGYLACAAWMTVSERVLKVNTGGRRS